VNNISFNYSYSSSDKKTTSSKINNIYIYDSKNSISTTYQENNHKLFDNESECLTYCATQTKPIEVVNINVPCLVYPHAPFTNEPVFITSAYNRQKESIF